MAFIATAQSSWTVDTGENVQSSPALGPDGTVYVGTGDSSAKTGGLWAMAPTTGAVKWHFDAQGAVIAAPTVGADGTIYVSSYDFHLYALNPTNGAEKWRFKTQGAVRASALVGPGDVVYLGSAEGILYALNPDTGQVRWSFNARGNDEGVLYQGITGSPVMDAVGIIYFGYSRTASGTLFAVDSVTRKLRWRFETGAPIRNSSAIGADGSIYFGCDDTRLYALTPAGQAKWPPYYSGNAVRSSPTIAQDGTVYFQNNASDLYALNGTDGTVKWLNDLSTFSGDFPVNSSPTIASNGEVIVGAKQKLYAITSGGNERVVLDTKTSHFIRTSALLTPDGWAYFGSDNNKFYGLYVGIGPSTASPWPMHRGDLRRSGWGNRFGNQAGCEVVPHSDYSISVNVLGRPSRSYSVFTSEDLLNWHFWLEVRSSNGVSSVREPLARTNPHRFYRSQELP